MSHLKFCLFALAVLLFPNFGKSQFTPSKINIVPKPVSLSAKEGRFVLNAETRIYLPKSDGTDWELPAHYFLATIQTSTGFRLTMQQMKRTARILRRNSIYFIQDEEVAQPEGYKLEVSPENIVVRAANPAGAFYAVQTLRQLFPPEINSAVLRPNGILWAAPGCAIEDYPRFQYRGLHLDVGRHFFKVEFVKRYIDLLATHKMNVFHWHLTDDQGWRIEIEKYPKLQTVAACRKETLVGHYSDEPERFDGKKYCGFYSKEEIRAVVEYARQRFVTVIPEIEMPGHAQAALAAYPELGCKGGGYETAMKWGVFDEVFCAGNEKTFEFLEGVLAEACDLFPGKYIHVGGDECPKTRWKTCPKCQNRIKNEGLKDEHELQSYFIRRAETMLAQRGKKLIGWDEILEGGLAPTATVMSWRGIEGGIAAAKAGHDVIMSPTDNCYLDYYQSEPSTEPLAIGGFLPIQNVYAYEPVPEKLSPEEAKFVLGVQANLWTEYIAEDKKAEYMVWPRAVALAETAWTSKDLKDWKDFSRRLKTHFSRLEVMGVNFSKAFYDLSSAYQNDKISLACNDSETEIRYTVDGSEPSAKSAVYENPFSIAQTSTIKAAAFREGKIAGKTLTVKYLVHKASGKPYTLAHQPTKFTGGETYGLTNGIVGEPKKWSAWVALEGQDLDPLIDLGQNTEIQKVSTNFLNSKVSWIYPPRRIEIFVSDDGKNFLPGGKREIDAEKMSGISMENVSFQLPTGTRGRFVKLVATHFGKIPADAPGAGNGAWIFLDEVVVE